MRLEAGLWILSCVALVLASSGNAAAAGEKSGTGPVDSGSSSRLESSTDAEDSLLVEMLSIRRIHVEKLGGDETAAQIRDMIIAAIQSKRTFLVTENPDRADAFLRGSAEDMVFTDQFSSSEGLSARGAVGIPTGENSRYSSRTTLSAGVSENESIRKTERKHEAMASVRLVSRTGDVLWSTTEESLGGKFRGSGADVAEKVARKLAEAMQQARSLKSQRNLSLESRVPASGSPGVQGNPPEER